MNCLLTKFVIHDPDSEGEDIDLRLIHRHQEDWWIWCHRTDSAVIRSCDENSDQNGCELAMFTFSASNTIIRILSGDTGIRLLDKPLCIQAARRAPRGGVLSVEFDRALSFYPKSPKSPNSRFYPSNRRVGKVYLLFKEFRVILLH